VPVKAAFGADGDEEAEPRGVAALSGLRQDYSILYALKRTMQSCPIVAAAPDERREFFELFAPYCRLHIRNFKVIAEVAVYIFVVVPCGQFAVLTVEAVAAEIVAPRRADAVPAPIPVGENEPV